MSTFDTESELTNAALTSQDFYRTLGYADWLRWETREPSGLFGIPDVVFCFARVNTSGCWILRTFAFEMKLCNWKRALTQAYKYAAFAHYPFVVMDHGYVERAKRHIDLFRRSNVGLLSIDPSGQTYVHFRPRFRQPYSRLLNKTLGNRITSEVTPPNSGLLVDTKACRGMSSSHDTRDISSNRNRSRAVPA